MFNPLEINKQDIEQLFEASAIDVLINDEPAKAIITQEQFMRETEDRNLHTLSKVSTGDEIVYQDEYYLIINETITKRHSKYKALMRHCNHVLKIKNVIGQREIGKDETGRPIFEDILGDPPYFYIPMIISAKAFSIDERHSLLIGDEKIYATVQDNEIIRKYLSENTGIDFANTEYTITHQDKTNVGLIVLTLNSEPE